MGLETVIKIISHCNRSHYTKNKLNFLSGKCGQDVFGRPNKYVIILSFYVINMTTSITR